MQLSVWEIGGKSRAYAEKYHSYDAVGKFFNEINKALGLLLAK